MCRLAFYQPWKRTLVSTKKVQIDIKLFLNIGDILKDILLFRCSLNIFRVFLQSHFIRVDFYRF